MRVLHAIAWPGEISGAPRSMEESLAALAGAGVEVQAWLATGRRVMDSVLPERLRARGIQTSHRLADTAVAPASVADLVRQLRSLGRGVVLHTHGERALLWGAAAARLAGAPHVHTNHGFVENDAADERRVRWARRVLRRTAAVIAVHPAAAAGLPGAHVVLNCLDAAAFRAEAGDVGALRRRLGLAAGQRAVLYCGRLEPEKGADLIALIQAGLQSRSASARLLVAGSGQLVAGVEAMSDVQLLGQRDDPAALLSAADVVVMPSRREGLPMTALEAAAVGTPVVGFAVGGLADSGLALPVPSDDVDALVQAALRLIRDSSARQAVLERSSEVLTQRFGPAAHAAALIEIYEAVSGP